MYYQTTIINSVVLEWKQLDQRNRLKSPEIGNESIKMAFQMTGNRMCRLVIGVGMVIYPLKGNKVGNFLVYQKSFPSGLKN